MWGVLILSSVGFTAAITYGNFKLFAWEDVGVFYDYQAESLLHRHWDVPDQAIHDEAFVVVGKSYGYFGPTPALLRLPVILFHPPVGHLARVYMLAYFVGSLVATYALFRQCNSIWRETNATVSNISASESETPHLAGARAADSPGQWARVVLLAAAGLGSPLLFLAGRPMMYTEAIACGAMFALWSAWCTLRWLCRPTERWWIGALVCGVLSAQSRPTSGLFAMALLGLTVVWFMFRQPAIGGRKITRSQLCGIAALTVAGVLTINAVAFLKFGTFDSAPLELSRPYLGNDRYSRVENKKFHLENIPWGFDCYFGSPDLKFTPRFPFLGIGYRNSAADHPKAKIDLPDFTVAAPFAMPALLALATLAAVMAFVRWPQSRVPLLLIWASGLPMAIVLCGFIAVAQRYLADFCPWLISSAAFGVTFLAHQQGRLWTTARAALAIVTAGSVLVSAALLFDYQCNWGPLPPEVKQRYQAVRDRLSPVVATDRH